MGQRVHPQRKNLIKTNPLAFIAFTNNVKIYLDIAVAFLSFASLILFQLLPVVYYFTSFGILRTFFHHCIEAVTLTPKKLFGEL